MPKKERTGIVISDKMDKTVVVRIPEYRPHPKYKKIMQQNKNYKANDFKNECQQGDMVKVVESRPTSKGKCWTVAEIVEKAK